MVGIKETTGKQVDNLESTAAEECASKAKISHLLYEELLQRREA